MESLSSFVSVFPGGRHKRDKTAQQFLNRGEGLGEVEFYYSRSGDAEGKPDAKERLLFCCTGRGKVVDDAELARWQQSCVEWGVHSAHRYSVILHNYPGYGDSSGCVTEDLIDEDNERLIRHIIGDLGWKGEQLYLFGNSIGTGPICSLATALYKKQVKVAGVVLVSYYDRLSAISTLFDQYKDYKMDEEKLRGLSKQRVFIVHGGKDETISSEGARELFSSLKDVEQGGEFSFVFINEAGHRETRSMARKEIGKFFEGSANNGEEIKSAGMPFEGGNIEDKD
jgi:pimeloyl-ACP methyl ester carboxylesterase